MKNIILFVFITLLSGGMSLMGNQSPPPANMDEKELIELKLDVKNPLHIDIIHTDIIDTAGRAGISEKREIGLNFILTNKSNEDIVFVYLFSATIMLYTVEKQGNREKIWPPFGYGLQGSRITRVIKPGESISFYNPRINIEVLKKMEGKSIVASV